MELLQETNKDADFAKSEDFVSDGLLDSMDVQMLAVAIEEEARRYNKQYGFEFMPCTPDELDA